MSVRFKGGAVYEAVLLSNGKFSVILPATDGEDTVEDFRKNDERLRYARANRVFVSGLVSFREVFEATKMQVQELVTVGG